MLAMGLGVGLIVWAGAEFWREGRALGRPNILVLSFCSLRFDHLNLYGYRERETSPNIDRAFSKNSVIFEKAFNSQSWTFLLSFLMRKWSADWFAEYGYRTRGFYENRYHIRVPHDGWRLVGGRLRKYVGRDFSKPETAFVEQRYRQEMEYMKSVLTDRTDDRPFFLIAHFKYMHFPFIDGLNADADSFRFLSAKSKTLLEEYQANYIRYPDKIPLFILLWNHPKYVVGQEAIRRRLQAKSEEIVSDQLFGLAYNEELLRRWQQSDGFVDDIVLLKELYDAKLRYLDTILAPVLDLYGDEELKKNTLVFFMGDHGEPLMDHGRILHGDSVHDTSLHVPLMMRFPDSMRVDVQRDGRQTYLGAVAAALDQVIMNEIATEDIPSAIAEHSGDVVIGRDCTNRRFSLRYKNEWKLIMDMVDGTTRLFDLTKDPGETEDVSARNPERVAELNSLFFETYGDFEKPSGFNCEPWPEL